MRYAQAFDTTRQNAYILMKQSEETLFNRRFTYFDREKKPIKSRWLQDVRYLDDEGAIEVCFTRLVVWMYYTPRQLQSSFYAIYVVKRQT